MLYVPLKCGAHQLWRASVASCDDQTRFVGDVHAVALVCSHLSYMPKIQQALWDIVQTLDYRSDRPPPDASDYSKQVIEHTFLRKERHVGGCLEYGEEAWLDETDPKVQSARRLLGLLNSDWRSARLTHHCSGGCSCSSSDDCKEKVYAALLACDVLSSSGTRLPTKKDWGSTWMHCGQQCLGHLCHRLLPSAVARAFPHWDSMQAPEQPSEDTTLGDVEQHRKFLRCKVWRCNKVLQDESKRLHWVVTTWTVEPLDHCLMRLQWLDGQSSGLLDAIAASRSPFVRCRRALAEMLDTDASSHLSPVRHFFQGQEDLDDIILKQCAGMAADVWIRFMEYEQFPLRLGSCVDARLGEAERKDVAQQFFALPECCVYTDMGSKLRAHFDSAESFLADDNLLIALRIVCKKAKLCNMHVERFFAAVRLACRHVDGAPDIERVRAVGMLRDVLTAHTEAGGMDPRFVTSAALVRKGVPLRRAKQLRKGRLVKLKGLKPGGGFARFAGKMEAERREHRITLASLGGRKARFADLSKQWADLSERRRGLFRAEAIVEHAQRRACEVERAARAEDEAHLSGGGFWGLSSVEAPFTTTALLDNITDKLGHTPGARKYLPAFRQQLSEGAFIADSGRLRAGGNIPQRLPCWLQHPGLCQRDHAAFYDTALAVSAAIETLEIVRGGFYRLEVVLADGDSLELHVYAALSRPKCRVLAICEAEDGDSPFDVTVLVSEEQDLWQQFPRCITPMYALQT